MLQKAVSFAFLTALILPFGFGPLPLVTATVGAEESSQPFFTRNELSSLLEKFRAGDDRIMRWSIKNPTQLAIEQGACDKLGMALDLLLDSSAQETLDHQKQGEQSLAGMVCEYATFCLTDNPQNRELFADHADDTLYNTIVHLIDSPDNYTSAMASHLVYISVFDNPRNHLRFYRAGAVAAVTQVILADAATGVDGEAKGAAATSPAGPPRNPHAVMWAAAALQNMAASYCNGRCRWDWVGHAEYIVVLAELLPVTSPGDSVRHATWLQPHGPALVNKLQQLLCEGPVTESTGAGTGRIHHDENNRGILPWAAAGALKNLVLEPFIKQIVDNPDTMTCVCRLLQSPDWLEENKAEGIVAHIRSSDNPCHYRDEQQKTELTCIDQHFVDEEGYGCDWYNKEEAKDDCSDSTDFFNKDLTADMACCGCGGGYRLTSDEPEVVDQ